VTLMNEQTNPHTTPDVHCDILWWTPIYSLLLWILMTSVFLTTYKRIVLRLSSTPKNTKKIVGCPNQNIRDWSLQNCRQGRRKLMLVKGCWTM
jgi:hypothetical protein